ncbi:DUF4199 domain-containing protein [Chitinophaga oryzae]|uniref:DUF4199 domain-containing protein n=1 Tax=Chitinophaga oryzae TaxID=2725414 RepID=A0AAE6ZCX1_9BACT|nr:DUF4199 domain-containing protein [Chitinophaga oryzae]QJB30648.1 DUF4199 domain-containing protein [Chitinophaga oryzae]QJB37148.1 DUF4199 domain-containing protein [Chitinophaga oryzae]
MNKNYAQYGLIISAILVVLSVLFYILNLNQERWAQWVGVAVMFVGIVITCINYAKINDGYVTFGNVFANGFKATMIITVITVIFSVIMLMIFPDIKDKAIEVSRAEMEKKGASEDQIEMGINFTKKFFLVFMVVGGLVFSLFFGAIASLVGAAAAQKKPMNKSPQP